MAWKMETFCIVIPLGMQQPGIDVIRSNPGKNLYYSLVSGREQNLGSQKR